MVQGGERAHRRTQLAPLIDQDLGREPVGRVAFGDQRL
jgi:hypothetical protein